MHRSRLSTLLSLSVRLSPLVAAQAVLVCILLVITPACLRPPPRVLGPPRGTRGDRRHGGGTSRRASRAQPHAGD